MENSCKKFRYTMFGKILRWLSLTLFAISLAVTLVFYNLSTVTTEKNIKTLAEKVVKEFLYQNKGAIDKNYEELISYAKLAPEENIEFPTGLEGLNINIKASELSQLSKEEFYDKMPAIVAESIYNEALNMFISEKVEKNNSIPAPIRGIVSNFKSKGGDYLFYNIFRISLFLTAAFCVSFFLLQKLKRYFFEVGAVFILVSLPPYLILYFMLPLANNVIRQTDFAALASLITDMTEQIQQNYLFSLIAGFAFFIIGFLVNSEINVRNFFRKKSEFERVIKT